jgi:hypothetical protein
VEDGRLDDRDDRDKPSAGTGQGDVNKLGVEVSSVERDGLREVNCDTSSRSLMI